MPLSKQRPVCQTKQSLPNNNEINFGRGEIQIIIPWIGYCLLRDLYLHRYLSSSWCTRLRHVREVKFGHNESKTVP